MTSTTKIGDLHKKTLGQMIRETEEKITDACYVSLYLLSQDTSAIIKQNNLRMLDKLASGLAEIYLIEAGVIYDVYLNQRVGKYSKEGSEKFIVKLISSAFELKPSISLKNRYTIKCSKAHVVNRGIITEDYEDCLRIPEHAVEKVNNILDIKRAFERLYDEYFTESSKGKP